MRTLFIRLTVAAVMALACAGFIASRPVDAATLRQTVAVDGPIVTLGDLFKDAGTLANQPVFRAPELGVTGALPAIQALAAARVSGLGITSLPDFANVAVTRRSQIVDSAAFTRLIATAAASRLSAGIDDVAVDFDMSVDPVTAALGASPLSLVSFTLQPLSGRFEASIAVEGLPAGHQLHLTGRAYETVAVPVLTRPLARRDVIAAADIATARMERRLLPAQALLASDMVIGKAARRSIRAGDVISSIDVEEPRLVTRGEMVTLSFRRPGMTLTAKGKALSDGAAGEVISVFNEQSRRTIQGTVAASGLVEVGGLAPINVLADARN